MGARRLFTAPSEAPYRTVTGALRSAYQAQRRDVIQFSKAMSQMRGAGVRLPTPPFWAGLTEYDRIAQAAMFLGWVRAQVGERDMPVIQARFSEIVTDKHNACVDLACDALGAIQHTDPLAAFECCLDWAGVQEAKLPIMARRIGISPRTARRWAQEIREFLDIRLANLIGDLGIEMRREKLLA